MAASRYVFECAYINAQICKAEHAYRIRQRAHTFIIRSPIIVLLQPQENICSGFKGVYGWFWKSLS